MNTIQIKGTVIFKHNIASEWQTSNYVPENGEKIIYDPDDITPYAREKIGNGVDTVPNLPFTIDPTVSEWARNAEPPIGTGVFIGPSEEWPEEYEVCIDPEGASFQYELSEEEMENIIDNVNESMGNEVTLLKNQVSNLANEIDTIKEKPRVKIVNNINEVIEEGIIYLISMGSDEKGDEYFEEYLCVEGFPELIGNTNISLNNYPTKEEIKSSSELYVHNIVLRFKDVKGLTNGTQGVAMASFTLINNDKDDYSFDHNPGSVQPMSRDNAWQLLRLYRALSTSTTLVPPTSGTSASPGIVAISMNTTRHPSSGSIILSPGTERTIVNTVWAGYFNYSVASSTINSAYRGIIITSTKVTSGGSDGGLDEYQKPIYCGRVLVKKDQATNSYHEDPSYITTSKNDFYTYEYLGTRLGEQGSTYFCQHALYCKDHVEKLKPYI